MQLCLPPRHEKCLVSSISALMAMMLAPIVLASAMFLLMVMIGIASEDADVVTFVNPKRHVHAKSKRYSQAVRDKEEGTS